MPTIFISHALQDAQFAHRLADDLRRLGMQVWIAPESIRPGEGWVRAIERGLAESSHMVVVLTPAALASKWVEKETDVAIARERKGRIQVVPLDVQPCEVPLLLSSYQMVSFRRDYEAGLSQLAAILGVRVTPPEPVRLLSPAPPHGILPEEVPPTVMKRRRPPEPEPVSPVAMERLQPLEPETALIPAGEFLMGSDPKVDKDALDHEQPQHTLYLPDYCLAKTPVTNAQYAAFVRATGCRQPGHWERDKPPKGKEDHPVVNVTWHDAVVYCNWLAEVTGKPYRLPSEVEWEKGARGSDGRIWPWGNRWGAKRCNIGGRDTTPVGAYPEGASLYGLLDMAGNVWEWTRSIYKGYPYNPNDGREDLEGDWPRVLRGGSWALDYMRYARCSYRNYDLPAYFDADFGFRVVLGSTALSGLVLNF